jgi:hypothetical protein
VPIAAQPIASFCRVRNAAGFLDPQMPYDRVEAGTIIWRLDALAASSAHHARSVRIALRVQRCHHPRRTPASYQVATASRSASCRADRSADWPSRPTPADRRGFGGRAKDRLGKRGGLPDTGADIENERPQDLDQEEESMSGIAISAPARMIGGWLAALSIESRLNCSVAMPTRPSSSSQA